MRALLLATCLVAPAACLEAPHTPEPRGCEADGGDTMSLPTPYFVNDHWYTANQWNAMMRFISRQLMDTLLRLWFGDSDPATDSSGVVGGFVASDVSGTMKSQVTAGAAVLFNASVYTDTLDSEETASDLGFMWCPDTTEVTHSTADATNDRIDLIVVSSTLGSDYSKTVGVKGGAPTSQDLRWGHETTIEIVTGTPAGSPSAPATPAGKMAIAEVLVPATETDAANFTYTDVREFVAGPYNRQEQALYYHTSNVAARYNLAVLLDGDGLWNSLDISLTHWWPEFTRDTGSTSGEKEGHGQPLLMWNADRTWKESITLENAAVYGDLVNNTVSQGVYAGFTGVCEVQSSGGGTPVYISKGFDMQHRQLEVLTVEVAYKVTTGLGGTESMVARVVHYDQSADSWSNLTTGPYVTLTKTSGQQIEDLPLASTPVMDKGDLLIVEIDVDLPAGTGVVELYSATMEVKEGRTP